VYCSKVSPGCRFCYAERMSLRLQKMGQANYRNGFELTLQPHMLGRPLEWKKPRLIFVNSMSDLFHEQIPLEYIREVFHVMHQASWHSYQILTKRSERLLALDRRLHWAPQIWMGVSVENAGRVERINHLRQTGAHVKFLSLEPLLGPLAGIDFIRHRLGDCRW
jgi:protein gp37